MLKSNDGGRRLFTPTLVIILIAVAVLVLGALGAYFYYFSAPGKYWHARGQKSGAEATKKAEFDLNEAMRIVSENYAYSLVEQPLLDTAGNALSKAVVKKEEVVVFGEAKTFDWSAGLQFRQIYLIDQVSFRPTGQGGWVTSASLVYFTSPKEAWEWGHREKREKELRISQQKGSDKPRFPSTVLQELIYDVGQEQVSIGYVNQGDVLTVKPMLISQGITWDPLVTDGKNCGLRGAGRLPSSLPQSYQFPADHLPIAALLIKVPGRNWEPLDQQKVFTIYQSGEVVVALNDRTGGFYDNVGKVKITAQLKTQASQARFPSHVEPELELDVTKETTLGYVNPGDILTVKADLTSSSITWSQNAKVIDSHVDLSGSKKLSPQRCQECHFMPSAEMPVGALIIKVPGQGWNLLDRERNFPIHQSGEVIITVNDRRDRLNDNQGTVKITAKLKTGSTS